MAFVVQAGEEADGADDGVGGDFDGLSLFDDVAKGEAKAAIALTEEIGGVGVAVDSAAVEFVGFGDGVDLSPVEKFLVDFVAFGMVANGAAPGVVGNEGSAGAAGFLRRFGRCLAG
ncbi:MAG: hypothetical protein WBQ34_18135 [Candidatus Acidiferrales bacterium]